MRTLLFTDLVDSTQLVQRLGDSAAAALWAEHDRRARQLLATHHGQEIDRSDGFFLLFDAALDAAHFALAYQREMAALQLSARVGLHTGEVSFRENAAEDVARGAKRVEVEGLAKPFAARVMALAAGGQTLLSATARDALAAARPAGSDIENHGHYRLKGIDEPAEIFELGLSGGAFKPPADTDKVYRVVRDGELWRPMREVRHNLAPERDAFIGRSSELRTLAHQLDHGSRLLTVLGPGGTGKTRLVRRYGRAWLGDWPGGVYFCDLSEARSLDAIYFAVASALAVPLGKDDPGVQLGHAIAGRGRCLVLLDNFEQVVTHAAATAGRWLDRAGEASFVVTSRELLHLPGEEVLPIEPLALDGDAIELFAARARAQRPDFTLNSSNQAAVAEVVRLLDGLPLAIELAAARVRVLSPAQIVARMAQRFQLLAGAKGAAARQATLKAAIDWSWDLLSAWEQAALAQCSVFEGGFTMEAAEAVLELTAWPEAPSAMDAVHALVDKSLLRAWLPSEHRRLDIDEPYFGMYLSIHEYAESKLNDSHDDAASQARARHGAYFAGFGSDAAIQALSHHGGVKKRRALAIELDNIVAACTRAIAKGSGDVAAANYRAAWEVLSRQGPVSLGVTLSARVLALNGIEPALRMQCAISRADGLMKSGALEAAHPLLDELLLQPGDMADRKLQGQVLGFLGQLHREQGRMHEAQHCMQSALAIFIEEHDPSGQGVVLHNLGNVFDQRGLPAESRQCHERALALYEQMGHRAGTGHVLAGLAILNRHVGRMDDARTCYQAALTIHREVGDRRSEGIVLGNLGNVLLDQGHVEQARAHYEAALRIHREVGSRIVEAVALANLGGVSSQLGRLDEAHDYKMQSLHISREIGNPVQEGVALSGIASVELRQARWAMAQQHAEQALVIHRATFNRRYEGVTLACLAEAYACQGMLPEAIAAFAQGEAVLRAIEDPVELANLLCARGRANVAAGDIGQARLALAEVEQIAARIDATPDSGLGRELALLRGLLP